MDDQNQTLSYSPATGEQIGKSELHTADDLVRMIDESRKAQIEWQKIPVKERSERILKIKDHLVDNIDALSQTISNDNGKELLSANFLILFV